LFCLKQSIWYEYCLNINDGKGVPLRRFRYAFYLSLSILLIIVPFTRAFGGVKASFAYPLSNFAGLVQSQWAKLAVDRSRNEVYALNRQKNEIRIFDENGMEIYAFGEGFSNIVDIAVSEEDGDIFVLTRRAQGFTIHVCDYRGEPLSELEIRNVPSDFSGIAVDRILYRHGSLYLIDSYSMRIMVTDEHGFFKHGYDIKSKVVREFSKEDRPARKEGRRFSMEDMSARKEEGIDINGFDVDAQGNMYFTVASLFSAFRMSADGALAGFGRPGGAPGKFGVVGGIAADDLGHIYVSDRLRCVVLVFDEKFDFQGEFGYRGPRPSNLIAPNDMVIDGEGKVYVSQAANRGVSVFKVSYE